MAQCHNVVVESVGYVTKTIEKSKSSDFDPLKDWPEEFEDVYDNTTIRLLEKPLFIHEIQENELSWTVTVKVPISISKSITTSDEEYKVYKLLSWDDEISQEDFVVKPNCSESFEVVGDDSYWVEDEDEDCIERGLG